MAADPVGAASQGAGNAAPRQPLALRGEPVMPTPDEVEPPTPIEAPDQPDPIEPAAPAETPPLSEPTAPPNPPPEMPQRPTGLAGKTRVPPDPAPAPLPGKGAGEREVRPPPPVTPTPQHHPPPANPETAWIAVEGVVELRDGPPSASRQKAPPLTPRTEGKAGGCVRPRTCGGGSWGSRSPAPGWRDRGGASLPR